MNSLRILALLIWVVISLPTHADEAPPAPQKDLDEPIAVGWYFNDISGTTLCTNETTNSQRKSGWSQHTFAIGYRREGEKKGSIAFIPIITLPPLENDHYEEEFSQGKLRISRKRAKKDVVVLNLKAIAPNTITKKSKAPRNLDSGQEGRDDDAGHGDSTQVIIEFTPTYQIEGTTLRMESRLSIAEKPTEWSEHHCRIGYEQEGVFVPVLSLRSIENDFYGVNFSNSKLAIKELRSDHEVLVLNLEALAPSAIIYNRMVQDWSPPTTGEEYLEIVREARDDKAKNAGARQPATAPDSKPDGNEKPKPESEGRSQ